MKLRAYKTELDPNDTQRRLFGRYAGAYRHAWNWGLDRKKKQYRETGKSDSLFALQRAFVEFKSEPGNEWMRAIPSKVFEGALTNLHYAYQNFFRRRKNGELPTRRRDKTPRRDGEPEGFPRFKSRKRGIGPFRLRGSIRVQSRRLRLPVIGWVRMKESDYMPTHRVKILGVVISERAGRWFAALQVEEKAPKPRAGTGPVIGLDVGLAVLAVASDGRVWEHPAYYRKHERKLARLQHKASRQVGAQPHEKRNSNERKKTLMRIACLHWHTANLRADYLHKLTTSLLAKPKPARERPRAVVIEDLNVRGMQANRHLSKSIADSAWAEIRRQLEYKCAWYGTELIVAPAPYTSQTCSQCGYVDAGNRRTQADFRCLACGFECNADLNAALNLEAYGLQHLAPMAEERLNEGGGTRPRLGRSSGGVPMKPEVATLAAAPALEAGHLAGVRVVS